MANWRSVLNNWCETNGVLKNGTGGGAPALDEVSPYLMTNALTHDRLVPWQQASGAAMEFDIDLGANRNVVVGAILGHRPIGSALAVLSCLLRSAPSSGGYPPAGWTTRGTFSTLGRDAVTLFSTVNERYWRFEFDVVVAPFLVSRLLLYFTTSDPGVNPRELEEDRDLPSITGRTGGDVPMVSVVGDIRSRFVLRFPSITASTLTILRTWAATGQSFLLIDPDNIPYEVVIVENRIKHRLVWFDGVVKVFECDVLAEQLG